MSRYASIERVDIALTTALGRLWDRERGLVKLFDPPYTQEDVGYINSYGPGFRENGGQYTHGAIWLAMACLRRGRTREGWALLRALLPETRELSRYGGEPYVLAADVSAAPGREGLAGWTWYTGSAGWYFRAVTECLLGLRLRGGRLAIAPALPPELEPCTVLWTDRRGAVHRIEYARGGVRVDGQEYLGGEIG